MSTKKILEFKNKYITNTLLNKLNKSIGKKNIVFNTHSIKTCLLSRSFCSICFGYSTFHSNYLGKSVGIISGQSVGEPGTQLTLRTFHMGGTVNKYNIGNKKYNTIFNCINKFNLIKKNFKIYSILKFKYNINYYKYISFIFYTKNIDKTIKYTLTKYNSIYILLSSTKLIYYTNIHNLLNKIFITSNIHKIYQRNKNKSFCINLNYTGEFLLKNSVNLIVKTIFNS